MAPAAAFDLVPDAPAVRAYYDQLAAYARMGARHEGAVRTAFGDLLRHGAARRGWHLVPEWSPADKRIRLDGALLDDFRLAHGFWEAKDADDDLDREIQRKIDRGYPTKNTIFQAPGRAVLIQGGATVFDQPLAQPTALVDLLRAFFAYEEPAYASWQHAVAEFKERVPELGRALKALIDRERAEHAPFRRAFQTFFALCQQAINPNLASAAVEEMLIQHLLTERIFRTVFNNPDFAHQNIIAREIEEVIRALIARHPSRHQFLQPLDRFYGAIETTAATIADFSQKQDFLNTVYEQFFQGFSVKVADTHGIVYTPQPIVEFMVRSVADILRREFGRSLGDAGVHILDPFVGTGNFILRVMHEIPRTKLPAKYAAELHCNEVMLLPYYIAAMNIEHEYYELTGEYAPFRGICLVDTFELAEERQISFFSQENTARVAAQKAAPIFVIIGNPPYNAGQLNENDNNKNRKYPTMDNRVAETYAADSTATNKNALSDVYVKAFRWASDRIGDEGIVAFVSNNGFLDGIAFDGMRKHLARDFSKIYHVNLKGNARTSGERRRKKRVTYLMIPFASVWE